MTLVVLGIGAVSSGPQLIFALARYFGERPLDIVFWEPNRERLDLFETFAQKAFEAMKNGHRLSATTDLQEALASGDRFLVSAEGPAWAALKDHVPAGATFLATSDGANGGTTLDWPERAADDPQAVAFQMLRWINGEEYLPNEIEGAPGDPIGAWLNSPGD